MSKAGFVVLKKSDTYWKGTPFKTRTVYRLCWMMLYSGFSQSLLANVGIQHYIMAHPLPSSSVSTYHSCPSSNYIRRINLCSWKNVIKFKSLPVSCDAV